MSGLSRSSTRKTVAAARGFRRRTFLALGGAAVAMAAGGVGIVGALPGRELNLLNWPDELPDPVIPNFEKPTGIRVKSTSFSQNDEQIARLQATGGEGFDLCQPTRDRAPQSVADLPKSTPQAEAFAKQLKSQGYSFVGPTSVYAFMQNVGVVNDHLHGCFRATDYRQHGPRSNIKNTGTQGHPGNPMTSA